MQVIFRDDFARCPTPTIGKNVLAHLVEEGKRANQVVERSLIVSVPGKTVMGKGRYDPDSDTLTVSGFFL